MGTVADPWPAFLHRAEPFVAAYENALKDPQSAQWQILERTLTAAKDTAFGKAHQFADIRSIEEYRRRVPVTQWQQFAPWIERATREHRPVVTAETPLFFERTSGSGDVQKRIPYTPALLKEFQQAVIVWLARLATECPAATQGRSYWTLSPPTSTTGRAPNGIPIGSASDSAYLEGSIAEPLMATVLVPACFVSGERMEAWRIESLVALLHESELAFVSVWSPTFLSALLEPLLDEARYAVIANRLVARLGAPRTALVEQAIADRRFDGLWPRLSAISCWMDGPSTRAAEWLQPAFPRVRFLPKGLLATEGVVSFSWGASGLNPLAVNSHFLEFVDEDGAARTVDELRRGQRYRPLLTTGGGLYRYELGDIVTVTDFIEKTPCVRYVGRADARTDMVGEKLDEQLVGRLFDSVLGGGGGAYLIPLHDKTPQRYAAVIPATLNQNIGELAARLEDGLRAIFHYEQAQHLGQLAPVEVFALDDPDRFAQQAWEEAGFRAGDFKARALMVAEKQALAAAKLLSTGP